MAVHSSASDVDEFLVVNNVNVSRLIDRTATLVISILGRCVYRASASRPVRSDVSYYLVALGFSTFLLYPVGCSLQQINMEIIRLIRTSAQLGTT